MRHHIKASSIESTSVYERDAAESLRALTQRRQAVAPADRLRIGTVEWVIYQYLRGNPAWDARTTMETVQLLMSPRLTGSSHPMRSEP